jgi:hypothetical protein
MPQVIFDDLEVARGLYATEARLDAVILIKNMQQYVNRYTGVLRTQSLVLIVVQAELKQVRPAH